MQNLDFFLQINYIKLEMALLWFFLLAVDAVVSCLFGLDYIGCYRDEGDGYRDLNGAVKYSDSLMTIAKCIDYCYKMVSWM